MTLDEIRQRVERLRAMETSKVLAERNPDAGVARNVYRENAMGFGWTATADTIEALLALVDEMKGALERIAALSNMKHTYQEAVIIARQALQSLTKEEP